MKHLKRIFESGWETNTDKYYTKTTPSDFFRLDGSSTLTESEVLKKVVKSLNPEFDSETHRSQITVWRKPKSKLVSNLGLKFRNWITNPIRGKTDLTEPDLQKRMFEIQNSDVFYKIKEVDDEWFIVEKVNQKYPGYRSSLEVSDLIGSPEDYPWIEFYKCDQKEGLMMLLKTEGLI